MFMVGNDPDDLSVEDRRIRSRKFDQLLKTGASPFLVTARKNQNPRPFAFRLHLWLLQKQIISFVKKVNPSASEHISGSCSGLTLSGALAPILKDRDSTAERVNTENGVVF
jgi:hypothetical protein